MWLVLATCPMSTGFKKDLHGACLSDTISTQVFLGVHAVIFYGLVSTVDGPLGFWLGRALSERSLNHD